MLIKGRFVTLRAMEPSDNVLALKMINDAEIEFLVCGWAFPVSEYSQNQWYKEHINDKNNHQFVIENSDSIAVGILALTNIDWKNRKAHIGIKILDSANRSKGIGTDSLMAIMRYCFDELQLHRLETSWIPENTISRNMFKKCGWKEEGELRQSLFTRGKYYNEITGGILNEDYYILMM